MLFGDINWIGVAIGAVFSMVLGTLWYGPFFGKLWMKLIGKSKEELSGPGPQYILTFIAAFVSALVLNLIVIAFGVDTWYGGLAAGAVVWVGIGVTNTLTTSIFNETHVGVWGLFAAYQLVVAAAEGVLFALW